MNADRKKTILPYLALGAGVLALSFSAIFFRWAKAPAAVMAFYRFGLAALFLFPAFVHYQRQAGAIPLKVGILPIIGGIFSGFDLAIFNTALNYTTAANVTLLNYTAPLQVALFAWLVWKERLKGLFWLGLGLTLTGALTVLGNDYLRHPTLGFGDLIALGGSVFYTGYFLLTEMGRRHLDTLRYTWLAVVSSAITMLVVCLLLRQPLSGYSAQTYLIFLASALFSQIGGYLSLSYALGHLPASVVSPTMIGQPVGTALLAIPLLGETLNPAQMLGGVAVLIGVYLVHLSRKGK